MIIDRISHDIPFYRSFLKNAVLTGTKVINNPFWWSADDKFFNYALATKLGVAVPPTVLLPHKKHPAGTTDQSMRNLEYPLNWDGIFHYIGFPAFLKPHDGGGWKSVYKVDSPEEFFAAYDESGDLCMTLQGAVQFQEYFRCYVIDQEKVHVMRYDPGAAAPLAIRAGQSAARAGAGRAHGGRRAQALPRAGLRPEHRGICGGGRHPLRHRLHESGARRRSGIGGPGELPMGRGCGGRDGRGARAGRRRGPPQLSLVAFSGARAREWRRHHERSHHTHPASPSESKRSTRPSIPDTRDLRSHIHAEIVQKGKTLLAERVKPEMHQSVVEIGTGVCRNIQEAQGGDPRHPPADRHAGARKRTAPGGRRHASVRPLARPGDLSRRPLPRDRGGHEDGGARQPDLRPARAHRRGGPRDRHPAHEQRALLPAAHPGALRQFAVLAGHGHGPAILPLQGVRQVSAHQHSRRVPELVRNSKTTSTC